MGNETDSVRRPDSFSLKRCFIALKPDAQTRGALARLPVPPGWRRVVSEDLHLTLAFLGGISERAASDLHRVISEANHALPPLAAVRFEVWPNLQRPRVYVLGFEYPPALRAMVESVQTGLRRLHLPVEERPFKPHITLARTPRVASTAKRLRQPSIVEGREGARNGNTQQVTSEHAAAEVLASFDAIGLFSSSGISDGPRYRAVLAQQLKG